MNNFVKTILSRAMSTGNNQKLSSLRYAYLDRKDVMKEDELVKNPITLFSQWMEEALNDPHRQEPNAMCISTVDSSGQPSSRMVLMKDYSERGFTFFTNYGSRKANELANNPKIAANLYWFPLKKQVRIEGTVEKVSPEESKTYFYERPYDSQIGAATSAQSTKIPNRDHLNDIEKQIRGELKPGEPVPIPNWGGYLIKPDMIEFWQGQSNRLHDRIVFRRVANPEKEADGVLTKLGENGWVYERLAP